MPSESVPLVVLVLSKPTGMLMDVPRPTWRPMPVPTPKPTETPGVPTVHALSKAAKRAGKRAFFIMCILVIRNVRNVGSIVFLRGGWC